MVRWSIWCQHSLADGLDMPQMRIRRYVLRLGHLQCFRIGKQVWASFVRHAIPWLFYFLTALQSCIKQRRGGEHLESRMPSSAHTNGQSNTAVDVTSTLAFYRGLVKLYRHGSTVCQAYPRCVHDDETIQLIHVSFPNVADMWVYVEHLLSREGRIQLSDESIMKIASPLTWKERLYVYTWWPWRKRLYGGRDWRGWKQHI